ncbi:MAG: transporter, partial [Haloplasmataceae bacterium]|nr:transporter [Haloplasmataceae bacterium]
MNKIRLFLISYNKLPKEAWIIAISRIINAMGAFVGPVMTFILKDKIGLSDSEAGFYMTLAGAINFFPPLIGGKLADTLGRKKTIIIFDLLGLSTYFICGFIEPSITLIYVMIIAGIFYSMGGPAHESLLADISNPNNRKQVYSLSYMGWNLGYAAGPIIAGFLFHKYLNLIFIGDAITTFLSLSLIFIFIKDKKNKVNIENLNSLEVEEKGSIFAVLIKRPRLLLFATVMIGFNFVYSQWSFLLPIHTSTNFGGVLGPKYYGAMASLNGAVVIAFTAIISFIFLNTKNYKTIVYGGLFYMLGFGLLGFLDSLAFFYISVFIFTLGEILLTISVMPYVYNHTPSSHRGRMSGTLSMIMGFGWVLGPFVMGQIREVLTI